MNGPRSIEDLRPLIDGISYVRNGRAHKDAGKLSRLPTEALGVLWVPNESADAWSIQKPHAFSAIRLAETCYRIVVAQVFSESAARACRNKPLQFLEDGLDAISIAETQILLDAVEGALEEADRANLFRALVEARDALVREHLVGPPRDQLPLFVSEEEELFDPILKEAA